MDEQALALFRSRLEASRQRMLEEGDEKLSPNRTDDAGRRDEDGQPLNEMNQAIASQQNRAKAVQLAQIEATLRRINGAPEDFGLCVECEEEIAMKRLELMPHVALCVRCQSKSEGDKDSRRRHLTDYQ